MGLIENEKKTKYIMVSAIQKGRQTQTWKVGDKVFERVSSFKNLDNVINKEGRISECVKDRIQVGNRAHAANHHTLKVRL
jgi:predicted transcriptional regulator